jgi:hypothetical protein
MKNLLVVLAFCGLTFNLSVLTYYHASIAFFWSPAPNTLIPENVSVEFNIRHVDYTKTVDITETKIAYAQKISADLFKAPGHYLVSASMVGYAKFFSQPIWVEDKNILLPEIFPYTYATLFGLPQD